MTFQQQPVYIIPPYIKELNTLLANLRVYQQKLLHYRWGMQLKLTLQVEEVLNKLHHPQLLQLDALATEIIKQGVRPLSTLQQYSRQAEIKEGRNFFDATTILNQLWQDQHTILKNVHRALLLSKEVATASCQDLLRHLLHSLYEDMDVVQEQKMALT